MKRKIEIKYKIFSSSTLSIFCQTEFKNNKHPRFRLYLILLLHIHKYERRYDSKMLNFENETVQLRKSV